MTEVPTPVNTALKRKLHWKQNRMAFKRYRITVWAQQYQKNKPFPENYGSSATYLKCKLVMVKDANSQCVNDQRDAQFL